MGQYEEKLQEDEAKLREYQNRIQEYEEKIEEVNKENELLRNSHKQAMNMVREIELKLNFSQGMVGSVPVPPTVMRQCVCPTKFQLWSDILSSLKLF